MIQIIGFMGAAYIFTRMFTAFLRSYPNDDKATAGVIKVLSLLTALFAGFCGFWLLVYGTELDPAKLAERFK